MERWMRLLCIGIIFPVLFIFLFNGCSNKQITEQFQRDIAALQQKIVEQEKMRERIETQLKEANAGNKILEGRIQSVIEIQKETENKVKEIEFRIKESSTKIVDIGGKINTISEQISKLSTPPAVEKVIEKEKPQPPRPTGIEQVYYSAFENYRKGELGQAVLDFEEIVNKYPKSDLADNAQYWIGEAYYTQKDYRQAIIEFQKVVNNYPKGDKGPDALLKIGMSYRNLRQNDQSLNYLQRVLKEYPKSEAAKTARAMISNMKGKKSVPKK